MAEPYRPMRRGRSSKGRSRSMDENLRKRSTDLEIRVAYVEMIKASPVRGKPSLTDARQADTLMSDEKMKVSGEENEEKTITTSVENGLADLRTQLLILAGRQEETTKTANRLVDDLQQTLTIIHQQQATLKDHSTILESRQEQIAQNQEWMQKQQASQGESNFKHGCS